MVSTKETVTMPALQSRRDEQSAFLHKLFGLFGVRMTANTPKTEFLHFSKFCIVTVFTNPNNKNYLRAYVYKTLYRTQEIQKKCLKQHYCPWKLHSN